jgi:hypothetical protein
MNDTNRDLAPWLFASWPSDWRVHPVGVGRLSFSRDEYDTPLIARVLATCLT